MDPGREIIFAEEKQSGAFEDDKKEGVYIDEKRLDDSVPTSNSDGSSLYVYERDNMVRDETGKLLWRLAN
jgi:predicted lipoprotein with Yx(FWY)xxD motif